MLPAASSATVQPLDLSGIALSTRSFSDDFRYVPTGGFGRRGFVGLTVPCVFRCA